MFRSNEGDVGFSSTPHSEQAKLNAAFTVVNVRVTDDAAMPRAKIWSRKAVASDRV